MPILKELYEAGVHHFRIEGKTYTTEQLRSLVRLYRQASLNLDACGRLYQSMAPVYAGFTLGSLQFGHSLELELTEA